MRLPWTNVLAAAGVLMLSIPAVYSAEIPVFEGFCTEMASKPAKLRDRLATYAYCEAGEIAAKAELQKHWSWFRDEDLKLCLRYKGTMNETKSYVS